MKRMLIVIVADIFKTFDLNGQLTDFVELLPCSVLIDTTTKKLGSTAFPVTTFKIY